MGSLECSRRWKIINNRTIIQAKRCNFTPFSGPAMCCSCSLPSLVLLVHRNLSPQQQQQQELLTNHPSSPQWKSHRISCCLFDAKRRSCSSVAYLAHLFNLCYFGDFFFFSSPVYGAEKTFDCCAPPQSGWLLKIRWWISH